MDLNFDRTIEKGKRGGMQRALQESNEPPTFTRDVDPSLLYDGVLLSMRRLRLAPLLPLTVGSVLAVTSSFELSNSLHNATEVNDERQEQKAGSRSSAHAGTHHCEQGLRLLQPRAVAARASARARSFQLSTRTHDGHCQCQGLCLLLR